MSADQKESTSPVDANKNENDTAAHVTSNAPASTSVAPAPSTRSGSILLHSSPLTAAASMTCSHVNVCRPWISWKKGNISEYVSKPRVFFDHLHHQIVLFTGSPPNKMWRSDRRTQTWMDYPIQLPPHNDIIGAQFSPDKTHVALRVSDKEVKVLSTSTGEVVTARSCRGTSSRMISVHWIHDPILAKTNKEAGLFLLFVTNAGVELYELTSEKGASSATSLTGSTVTGGGEAGNATPQQQVVKNKLKHIKTATYNIVYHWILLDENILLLVDAKNVFQAYRLSSKSITKICKFELDCAGTSLNPPHLVSFHREQISLIWLYGRMVILFVNEQKGQLHLLSLTQPNSNGALGGGNTGDEVEQTHVFDLYQPGKYDISNLDNVLVVHNTVTKLSMLFDVRSESKTTITEPLPIGPPLLKTSSPNDGFTGINYFDPSSLSSWSGSGDVVKSAPGMSSLAPATFHPYTKWTFLAPQYVWESTGDQQQGNLWTLQLNLQQMAFSWPNSKRTRLVDFLLKRNTPDAKALILQIILQIVCTEPSALALLSRLFSLLNRMNYDHRMNPHTPPQSGLVLSNLPLLPPFSNPPSAASTAPNSTLTSPSVAGRVPSASVSVSPYRPSLQSPGGSMTMGGLTTTHGVNVTTPIRSASVASPHHRATISGVPEQAASTPIVAGIGPSHDLDDSLSVLSCEMIDIPALLAQPLTVEQNLHGYMLVSQLDIFLHVFSRAQGVIPLKQLIPVVVEYLRSVHRHFLKPEDIVNDLLVSLLLQDGQHYELHQFLQYHILNDSLPIANRLVASSSVYPPAYQIGIDMLYRLNAIPRLTRVLLCHGQVTAALKLLPNFKTPILDQFGMQPRDFLQVSVNTGDDLTFYHTYKFFELRNHALRGSPTFLVGDGCEEFVQMFQEKFPNSGNTTEKNENMNQYINLGDDDGEDDDDVDTEYFGPKPSIHVVPSVVVDSDVSSSDSRDPASSSSANDLRLPTPVDLARTMGIPSATPANTATNAATSGIDAEAEEDNQAESGLGADQIEQAHVMDSPVDSSPLGVDGSFGGSSERAAENPAAHAGAAEPAM